MARLPIYAAELGYLDDRLAATIVSRKVVPLYAGLLAALAQNGSLLPVDDLAAIAQELETALAGGRARNGPLGDLQGEIGPIVDLARAVNVQRAAADGMSDPTDTATRLTRLLEDAKNGRCAVLDQRVAPKECASAAAV